MQLHMLIGILFLNVVAFVASQTDREEAFQYYAVSNRTKQTYVHTTVVWANRFGASLTKEIAKTNQYNFVYSPFSSLLGITMLSIGARRYTEQLMRKIMGFEVSHIPRGVAFHELLTQIGIHRGIDFEIANAVFLPHRLQLEQTVVDALSYAFLSTTQQVDFSKPREASNTINQWCDQGTRGHITNIVKPADFTPSTSIVLVDAIHFTGAWLENFDRQKTRDMPFYCLDGKERALTSMTGRQLLRYSEHAPTNSKIVELPFKTSDPSVQNVSLFLVLPQAEDGGPFLQTNWEKIKPKEISENGVLSVVNIQLPKVSIAGGVDLIQPLKNLGLGNIFHPTQADFGGFFPPRDSYYDSQIYPEGTPSRFTGFYVNKIIQKARIDIHEGNSTDVPASEYLVASLHSNLYNNVEFYANHTFWGTLVMKGKNPITLFTFRFSGIAEPTPIDDLHLDVS